MLGIAYKKNVDDVRESPSVEIMQQLSDLGARVEYSDPYFPEFPQMRRYDFALRHREISAETLQDFDCVVLGVDHDCFDYELIAAHAPLLVDTRGRIRQQGERFFRA
jgi:UDP-N-acetyl-D-glucosamine dehydrogenase